MRIFNAFLIIIVSAILFLLPLTEGIYDFRTDLQTDTFSVSTNATATAANVTLLNVLYDNDTTTISILSDTSADIPVYSSYNITSRDLEMSGLAVSTTRIITASYDVDALEGSDAINTIVGYVPFIWLLAIIGFAPAALVAIFTGRA